MASVNSVSPQSFLSRAKSKLKSTSYLPKQMSTSYFPGRKSAQNPIYSRNNRKDSWIVNSVVREELNVIPAQSSDSTDQQEVVVVSRVEAGNAEGELTSQAGGLGGSEGRLSFEGVGEFQGFGSGLGNEIEDSQNEEMERLIDRTINATIVLAAGTFAITKLLTIDHDYWHKISTFCIGKHMRCPQIQGWTIYEILRYAPQHNWSAYEDALKTNPVFAKMVISGVVYSVGDWIAQCFEGKPLFQFDRARMFRSGLVGFTLHGSLSHFYYHFCEELFPFQDWWVVPAKVIFDQTAWSAVWNSIYFIVLGFLRLESPLSIFSELKATFWLMLTAGWKLWPFAHLITYGVIPVEQRLLWVDCVELIWVTILSTYSNEKSEARIYEESEESNSNSPSMSEKTE